MWYAWALEKIRRGTAVTALRLLCTVGTFKVYIFLDAFAACPIAVLLLLLPSSL